VNAILPGPVDGPRIRAVIKAKAAAASISENEMTERTVATTSLKCFVSQQDIEVAGFVDTAFRFR
jgi:hypothetical protein